MNNRSKINSEISQRDNYKQYLFLIPPLMTRNVTYKEIGEMLAEHGFNPGNTSTVICTLSNHYPIFSPSNSYYRILTREILEQYEKEELERRRMNKMFKGGKK